MINLYNANTEFYGTCYKAIIEEGKEKKKKCYTSYAMKKSCEVNKSLLG